MGIFSKKQSTKLSSPYEKVIEKVILSEKSTLLTDKRVYTFVVNKHSNKQEIAKAVHVLYNVDPIAVRIVTMPSKPKFRGGKKGATKPYKKAYVEIKEGQSITLV